jgi:NADH-quinone oxidoreductase subunit G
MVKIQINGTIYEVNAERNLLHTCIALGFNIPYFCFHPALGSVGACRLCAVKRFSGPDDKKGKIVMSCMEPVSDGLIISVDHPDAIEFRASVIEGLMTNHPHDCPVCDEGGECHLQDMTVMTGHNYSKYVFRKRTHKSQYLGPLIHHEMNRCIQCYRCVRFYKDYAGGKDLNVFGAANRVFFGRRQEGILESDFSGNLVEVCPTGVFTDNTLKKHFARKWDMTHTPSVCVHCSLGCNTILSERYGSVRRTMSRYNSDINGYFLCDRGRFGYEFLNSPERIKKIIYRTGKSEVPSAGNEIQHDIFSEVQNKGRILGIGSPRASLESNFALFTLVGEENFFHGTGASEQSLVKKAIQLIETGLAHVPSLKEIEKCDTVFILGEDVSNTAPMMALAIRQALRNKSIGIAGEMGIPKWNDSAVRNLTHHVLSPLYIASPITTKLDELAGETWYTAPEDIARLGFAVASAIHPDAPSVIEPEEIRIRAEKIADALLSAENPLIVTGINTGNMDLLNAIENMMIALSRKGKKPGIAIVFPECNSAGLGMMDGGSLENAIDTILKEPVDILVILENDLYRRIPKERAGIALDKCRRVIVLDHLWNETAKKADLLLPVASYAESAGTLVNNEGRAQRYYPAVLPDTPVKENWRVIAELIKLKDNNTGIAWETFDQVVDSLALRYPVFSGIREHLPNADFRYFNEKIARQPLRFSGRTAIHANQSVNEQAPPEDTDSPLDFSMEGYQGFPPPALIPYYWSPGWNSTQASNKYLEEPDGRLKDTDPGVKVIQKTNPGHIGYYRDVPGSFQEKGDEIRFIPVYRVFGSEELSSRGQAISEMVPEPFVLLNKKEANRLNLVENRKCKIEIEQVSVYTALVIDNHVPDGLAGLPALLQGMEYIPLPGWGKIIPGSTDE